MRKNTSGFTIVELLIVIVVIAILAAISIVSYSTIQRRANNTQRVAAAKDWQKIIIAYTAQNGDYPTGNGRYCLGSGYPTNWDANPDDDCLHQSSIKHPSTSLSTAFASIAPAPNFPSKAVDRGGGDPAVGISYRRTDTVDGVANWPYLWYWLEGTNQDCGLRPVIRYVSNAFTIDQNATYYANEGNATLCRIALPNPTSL